METGFSISSRLLAYDDSVNVLLGNGDGTFQAKVSYDWGGWTLTPLRAGISTGTGFSISSRLLLLMIQ